MFRMGKRGRIVLAGLGLLIGGVVPASAGAALNVSTSATTAVSRGKTISVATGSGTVPIQIGTLQILLSVSFSGGLTVPSGGVTFSGGTIGGVAATLTQTSAWSGQITGLTSGSNGTGVQVMIQIPNDGIKISSVGNDIYLGGSYSELVAVGPVAFRVPFTLNSIAFTNSVPRSQTLVVTRVSGTLFGAAVGDPAVERGTYNFSPGITMTFS